MGVLDTKSAEMKRIRRVVAAHSLFSAAWGAWDDDDAHDFAQLLGWTTYIEVCGEILKKGCPASCRRNGLEVARLEKCHAGREATRGDTLLLCYLEYIFVSQSS